MPGDGIDTAERIAGLPRAPKVVMLTVSEEDDDVIRALEAGAIGYILKGINARELIGAVKSIAAGNSFVSPNLTRRLLDGMKRKSEKSPISTLTRQEERPRKDHQIPHDQHTGETEGEEPRRGCARGTGGMGPRRSAGRGLEVGDRTCPSRRRRG